MTFHKEGIKTVLFGSIFFGLVTWLSYKYIDSAVIKSVIYWICAIFFLIILQFFRKPRRRCFIDDSTIISPADGKVVVIEEVEETEYFNEKRLQVSIFMSPFNVHINWFPINGIVKYIKYHPGLFLVAWHPKSSTDNERTTIVVEAKNKKEVLFRQIAGALARRIVYYPKVGEEAVAGSEFGFIKFGSRVDLLLPIGTELKVEIGDKVVGTRTVIGKI